ncbi:DUF63 family protein [Archaeoglobus profundus]|uniref:DUF63 family protein n=1 Tax=Archaeoglobus profundus (strain DSM 5631 / JCM 9629 / NBRC 100127 / Av18) TaxID=572546 RepID=D2RHI8_ARCPA|nr:DUF63 family protein [Archaeoglobus profundus]ADB57763.1 Protein of unknown function DUF63 [Archaeoglobus profundus DSM 5631]
MIWDFIKKYYIDSIVYKTGYNPVNTVTWAIILILAVYAIYKYLSKRLSFDERFFISNVPYVFFGSFLRVVEDAGFLKPPLSYFFMSPFIYVVVFCIAFPSLLLNLKLRKENYWKHHFALGVILSVLTLSFLLLNLEIIHIEVLPISAAIATFATALFYLPARFLGLDKLSISVFFSHMLDASATFYGITYLNYWELHVIPRLLINQFGAWVLIPTKFVVFTLVLWILEKERDVQLKNFIKFVLLVLGLAPATRDITRMIFYV